MTDMHKEAQGAGGVDRGLYPHTRTQARAAGRFTHAHTHAHTHRHGQRDGSTRVVLTLLGGGVFGNDVAWILEAIRFSSLSLPLSLSLS